MNHRIQMSFIKRLENYFIDFIIDIPFDTTTSYCLETNRLIKECVIPDDEQIVMIFNKKILYYEI